MSRFVECHRRGGRAVMRRRHRPHRRAAGPRRPAASTFAPGQTSGQFITGANGVTVPFADKQPVQGFSGVIPGPVRGTYRFILDNGFGAKNNSADSLLRVFALRPDFRTGSVAPVDFYTGRPSRFGNADWFITLRDPRRRLGFKAVADAETYPNGPASIPVARHQGRAPAHRFGFRHRGHRARA